MGETEAASWSQWLAQLQHMEADEDHLTVPGACYFNCCNIPKSINLPLKNLEWKGGGRVILGLR